MFGRPANLLRVLVMVAMATLVAILVFAPQVVEIEPEPPAPSERFQDLRILADGYRKTRLGTTSSPLHVPAAPADCTALITLPVETPCDALDGPGTVGSGKCAIETHGDARRWLFDVPAGFEGSAQCVIGACASAWIRVAPGPGAADPAIKGRWTSANGAACAATWPGTAAP